METEYFKKAKLIEWIGMWQRQKVINLFILGKSILRFSSSKRNI